MNWYDVEARNYDSALGRWMNIDPLTEKLRKFTPFNYAFNNPVVFVDYDGMLPVDPVRKRKLLKGDLTSVHDLGNTGISSLGIRFNKESKEYYLRAELQISTHEKLESGNSFSRANPGLAREVKAHEESHADQFEYTLRQNDYNITIEVGNNEFNASGDLDLIVNKFIEEIINPILEEKLSEKEKSEKTSSLINLLLGELSTAIQEKFLEIFGPANEEQNCVEDNCIQRTDDRLRREGIIPSYQNYLEPFKNQEIRDETGKIIPNK